MMPGSIIRMRVNSFSKTKQYFAFAIQKDGTQKKLKEWQGN